MADQIQYNNNIGLIPLNTDIMKVNQLINNNAVSLNNYSNLSPYIDTNLNININDRQKQDSDFHEQNVNDIYKTDTDTSINSENETERYSDSSDRFSSRKSDNILCD